MVGATVRRLLLAMLLLGLAGSAAGCDEAATGVEIRVLCSDEMRNCVRDALRDDQRVRIFFAGRRREEERAAFHADWAQWFSVHLYVPGFDEPFTAAYWPRSEELRLFGPNPAGPEESLEEERRLRLELRTLYARLRTACPDLPAFADVDVWSARRRAEDAFKLPQLFGWLVLSWLGLCILGALIVPVVLRLAPREIRRGG